MKNPIADELIRAASFLNHGHFPGHSIGLFGMIVTGLSNERLQEIFMTDMGSDGISGGGILAPRIRPSQNVILFENARRERQSSLPYET
jgi:hypothetical protein